MMEDAPYITFALAALALALSLGPTRLAVRGLLRPIFGPKVAKARAASVALGLGTGALASTLLAGLALGGVAAMLTAALALLLLLAMMDFAWRWLPLEWVLPLGLLSLGLAFQSAILTNAMLGAAMAGGVLFGLRAMFLLLRGEEAMGLGDVWLALALGALVGPANILLLLAAASVLGLLLHFASLPRNRPRFGVAFGAHLCLVTPLFL